MSKTQKELIHQDLLDEIAAVPSREFHHRFDNGFGVRVGQAGDPESIAVEAPDGSICIRIRMDSEGPSLELSGRSLHLKASNLVSVDCEDLEVSARRDIRLKAGRGLSTEGFQQEIRATHGDIRVVANDDVRIDGETVNLNNPRAYQGRGASPSIIKA